VAEQPCLDRYAIDERAIDAVQIGEGEATASSIGVAAKRRGVRSGGADHRGGELR
jgi:hypothetical protein